MKNCLTGKEPASAFRSTCIALAMTFLGMGLTAVGAAAELEGSREALPAPIIDPHSTEICMNSRISYHGGWSAAGNQQMLGDVLHAAAQAPITGEPLMLYAATSENVYLYDPESHSLVVHKSGNWRSDNTAAFEVGVAAGNMLDAGAAMHLAQLESVALWTGTANQLASCPRATATTYANSNWNPIEPIDIAVSFGIRSVPGLTTTLVAISSDASLPDPETDGAAYMDSVLEDLAYGTSFAATELGLAELSQLLWGAYGCSNHMASGKGGLVCSSAQANYYLTRRIYLAGPEAVHRYHNRVPPGTNMSTRDHRVEVLTPGDVRAALRTAIPELPVAPHYLIICAGQAGDWPGLEAGFAAMGALLQASSLGLQGCFTADLSAGEQAAIRSATGIPAGDLPMVVVSLGAPAGPTGVSSEDGAPAGLELSIENRIAAGGDVAIRYGLPSDAVVHLAVYDCLGREARTLAAGAQNKGPHSVLWDGLDEDGRPVVSGVYLCHLKAGHQSRGAKVLVIR